MFDFQEFLTLLRNVKRDKLFNPYYDVCPFHDNGVKSYTIRSMNLHKYFKILDKTDTLLIGEAAGYLGCRRTGIAFTDELSFDLVKLIWNVDLIRATKSGKSRELSASVVWNVLNKLENPPFLWNIIPMHPNSGNSALDNRTPTNNDYKAVKKVTEYFLERNDFERIFTIGRISEKILGNLGFDVKYIRHPSHGGANLFSKAMFTNFKRLTSLKKANLSNYLKN